MWCTASLLLLYSPRDRSNSLILIPQFMYSFSRLSNHNVSAHFLDYLLPSVFSTTNSVFNLQANHTSPFFPSQLWLTPLPHHLTSVNGESVYSSFRGKDRSVGRAFYSNCSGWKKPCLPIHQKLLHLQDRISSVIPIWIKMVSRLVIRTHVSLQ